MSIDKALYLSNEVYQSAKDAGYHCYAMTAESETSAEYPWGASFVNYLAGGKSISFDSIQNYIYYLLDNGSTVNDVIGCDFDFVNDASKLLLTVDGETLSARAMTVGSDRPNETTCYAFGEGQGNEFVLHYYAKGKDGNSEERFVWDINRSRQQICPGSADTTGCRFGARTRCRLPLEHTAYRTTTEARAVHRAWKADCLPMRVLY